MDVRRGPRGPRRYPSAAVRQVTLQGDADVGEAGTSLDRPTEPHAIETRDLSKSYGSVHALRHVSWDVRRGEVHGLCGHNGAGKSTLVKILAGVERADSGVLIVDGVRAHFNSPEASQRAGIALLAQERTVAANLSVEDNIFLGLSGFPLLYRQKKWHQFAEELLASVGLENLRRQTLVSDIPVGKRVLVEVARLLARDGRILILDEPTASLSAVESDLIFRAIRRVADAGRTVIYVSHRLDELFELCQRVTVFRDGERIATSVVSDLDHDSLIHLMIGERSAAAIEMVQGLPRSTAPVLDISQLMVPGRVRGFSITVCSGQVIGLSGQVGSGASDVLRAVAGLIPEAGGRVSINSRLLRLGWPTLAARSGVRYVPRDRLVEGLFAGQSVAINLLATRLHQIRGALRWRKIMRIARELADAIGVAKNRLEHPVTTLSGGNQQKVLVGRCLSDAKASVVLADEPTQGVDVGARPEIHRLLRKMAADGKVLLIASTDVDELLEISDTVVTMFAGDTVAIRPRRECSAAGIIADISLAPDTMRQATSPI